jgi:hypothetical protein
MKIKLFLFILASFTLFSCEKDTAYISVTNNVHNVILENISYNDIYIGGYLLPGDSTGEKELSEESKSVSFPMSYPVKFYMVKGDNKVLLLTKENFSLHKDDKLNIVINDETEVINPMNRSTRHQRLKDLK